MKKVVVTVSQEAIRRWSGRTVCGHQLPLGFSFRCSRLGAEFALAAGSLATTVMRSHWSMTRGSRWYPKRNASTSVASAIWETRFGNRNLRPANQRTCYGAVSELDSLSSNLARKKWRLEGNRETGETVAEEAEKAKLLMLQEFPITLRDFS